MFKYGSESTAANLHACQRLEVVSILLQELRWEACMNTGMQRKHKCTSWILLFWQGEKNKQKYVTYKNHSDFVL